MYEVMIFLHVLGAVGMGIYAVMPFIVGKFKQLSGAAQEGFASGLISAGRFGQYALVLQLLTGGYLISQADYTVAWMIVILVIFMGLGALSGIVQKPLKRIVAASAGGTSASDSISRVQLFSAIIFVLFLVMIYLMKNPWYVAS